MPEDRQPERPRRAAPERFPGNSHVEKQETQHNIQKVALQGAVKVRAPLGRRIRESITGDDAQTIGDYLLFEILIPNLKSLVVDAGGEALERMFFPTGGGRRSTSRRGSGSSFSGGSFSPRQPYRSGSRSHDVPFDREERRRLPDRARNHYRFDDIILETRGDAEVALENMREAVDVYGQVAVDEVLDMLNYGDDKNWMMKGWGWTDLTGAHVERLSSVEYRLNLPDAVKLPK